MARILPSKPSERYLREEAKDLLKSFRRGDASACAALRLHHRFRGASDKQILAADVSLQEMQHALALDYGFTSWRELTTRAGPTPAAVDVIAEFREHGNKAAERVADAAAEDDAALESVLSALASREKKVKNAAASALRFLGEKHAERVRGRTDLLAGLLDGSDNILKWNAARVAGCVVAAGPGPDDRLVERLLRLSGDAMMITAGNAVAALGVMAAGRPDLRRTITETLLRVDLVERNPECRNILIGITIEALGRYAGEIEDPAAVVEFVNRHKDNRRNSTRKRAERFLRDLGKRARLTH